MTLDERTATVLGWQKLRTLWVRIPLGALSGPAAEAAPPYSTDWSLVEEMLVWLRERCCLSSRFYPSGCTDVYATTRPEDHCRMAWERGDMAWESGVTFPEALAKAVVCVEEALRTGKEVVYREAKA